MKQEDSCLVVEKVAYAMTIGDLKYGNQKPGVVEASLKHGVTLEQALDELDDRLTAWHKKRYPHLYTDGQSPETVRSFTPQQTGASVMEIQTERGDPNDVLYQVQNAPSLEVLATYKTLAANSKTLYPAYCERLKYLSAKPI
ncbi:MAG TPA: hypothetical protein VMR70_04005 [Flavisolibacter sp.]|nr:hypothetical protein [Flavisolibacter sp.]